MTTSDYDREIWIVFAVAILSSVGILLCFYFGILKSWGVGILGLGFGFFVYSCFLILAYEFKKEKFNEIVHKFSFLDRSYLLERELSLKLENSYYPRVKWMAEAVLLCGIFVYIYAFSRAGIFYVMIPILILCFALLIHLWNNKKILEDTFKK